MSRLQGMRKAKVDQQKERVWVLIAAARRRAEGGTRDYVDGLDEA